MENKRKPALSIMGRLIVLVKPLMGIMLLGIALGTIGHLCAIFITVLAGKAVSYAALEAAGVMSFGRWRALLTALIVIAVLRGVFHYGEQYCNHYIAFRILAIIRHKVFAALRKLCPAKLEGKDKGNLIAVITGDIELLEVFFAHTISPIAIAVLVSLFMCIYIGRQFVFAGIVALIGYVLVGVVIPVWNEKRSADKGLEFRNAFGKLGSFVLSLMYGLDETLTYAMGKKSLEDIRQKSDGLAKLQEKLSGYEKSQRALTGLVIQLVDLTMIVVMAYAYMNGRADLEQMLTAVFAMLGSFGPVAALAALSNNLNQTLASGERVLALLDEEPVVLEVTDGRELVLGEACEPLQADAEGAVLTAENVGFSYDNVSEILNDFSMEVTKGRILGIHGQSGSGKSTLLRLIMRFWDANSGHIRFNDGENADIDIKEISTASLRANESFVTQDTWMFHDTVSKNIAVAKQGASREEIETAAKKAGIHDFIMSLPEKYETKVGELGDNLSGGEKQRIGLARAFLHDAPLMLLDEPTSSLDSLNEGIILKSLKEEGAGKTVILVSHRLSTMGVADSVVEM